MLIFSSILARQLAPDLIRNQRRTLEPIPILRLQLAPGDDLREVYHTFCNIVGGVLSPLLANIVLHELDSWLETEIGANPAAQSRTELKTRVNPQYQRLNSRVSDLRRYLDGKRPIPKTKDETVLRQELREKLALRRQIPSRRPQQAIYYSRFADDFLMVLCHTSKAEAHELKQRLAEWLQETLGLTLNAEKTLITHWQNPLRFLGYQLQGRRNARGTPWLYLSVPPAAAREVVNKIKQATAYPQAPAYDVVQNVNAIGRGWTNYYRFAHNSNKVAGRLIKVVFWRVAHYLGQKHRQSIRKVMRQHYARDPKTNCLALYVHRPGAKPDQDGRCFLWHKRPKRLRLIATEATITPDLKPALKTAWMKGYAQADRLEALSQAQYSCQNCGRRDVPLVRHHPNRLRNAKRVQKGNGHVARSGADQPGKILCRACHLAHHHGHTSQ